MDLDMYTYVYIYIYIYMVGGLNPSEKWWSSSVGMMIPFPIYGKSVKIPWFQSPPTRILIIDYHY